MTQTIAPACTFKTDKGRQCKLDAGHEGQHRMQLRGEVPQPKSLTELRKADPKVFGSFTLKAEAVPLGHTISREVTRTPVERDTDQKRADADAKAAYEAWIKAGKPEDKQKIPHSRYIVPPGAFDTVIKMLRLTTQSGGPVNGKRVTYTRGTHESGNTIIYFAVTDPFPKRAADKS